VNDNTAEAILQTEKSFAGNSSEKQEEFGHRTGHRILSCMPLFILNDW